MGGAKGYVVGIVILSVKTPWWKGELGGPRIWLNHVNGSAAGSLGSGPKD